jgi:hypothetical protein
MTGTNFGMAKKLLSQKGMKIIFIANSSSLKKDTRE